MRKAKPKQRIGSHLQGYIDISYDELVAKFGEPHDRNIDGKVQAEWAFMEGIVLFTIYDYKNCTNVKYIRDWHVGGQNKAALTIVKSIFPNHEIST